MTPPFREAPELFRQDFSTAKTLAFDLEKDMTVWLRFIPDAMNYCLLALPSGENLRLPGPDGKYYVSRRFPQGEVRIFVGDGDGELLVTTTEPSGGKNIPSFAAPRAVHADLRDGAAAGTFFAPVHNVRNFGAAGDGAANDTRAIQKAIDAGGAVYLPAGTYRTGTLYLRSNGGLTLAPDARLIASADPADYNAPDFCPQNTTSLSEKMNGAHLIVALECENVYLDGCGVIDGNRPAFFDPDTPGDNKIVRPGQMLFFCESRNVRVENLNLVNSPYWNCYFHGCSDVKVDGVRINNHPRNSRNGDGIGIDCCKNVTVANCIVRASDDCLTIRASGPDRLRHQTDGVCENVLVSNCVLMKGHCGVRIGVGSGTIRNCAVSNCAIKDCWFGIGIHSSYRTASAAEAPGVDIENIIISNIAVDGGAPFYIADIAPLGAPEPVAEHSPNTIRNISICNLRAKAVWNAYLAGAGNSNISELSLTNIAIEVSGGDYIRPDLTPAERAGMDVFRCPAAIYAVNLRNSLFQNIRITRDRRASGLWRKKMELVNNVNVELVLCETGPLK